jgi:maleate isomerase
MAVFLLRFQPSLIDINVDWIERRNTLIERFLNHEDKMKSKKSSFCFINYNRRRFIQNVTNAGLTFVAASSVLNAIIEPAKAASGDYMVGCVKPLTKPPIGIPDETIVDLLKLLPAGIKILPDYMNLTKGTKAEMQDSLGNYEKNTAYLAEEHCDLISIEGAPPFMVLGRQRETALIDGWEKKYKTPMFTSSQNQVNAFKAVKAKNIYGVTPFSGSINKSYADYFVEAGYNSVAIDGISGIPFSEIQNVKSGRVYSFIKRNFLKHKGVDTIYILGSAWNTLDIIEPLEQDLGVTVINPVAARAWEIQKRLHIYQPVQDYGRLLATLPS